jgi:S1-C subfamily serine protease
MRLPLVAVLSALAFAAAGCSGGEGGGADTGAVAQPAAQTTTAEPDGRSTGAPEGGAGASTSSFGLIPDIVQDLEPSVVAVQLESGEGSGVVWNERIVVTNNHVVEGMDAVELVFADGSRADARVRASDPVTDLAILEVPDGNLPGAEFAEQLPRVGELAIAMGNPLGLENTVTAGIVSAVHRSIPGAAQGAPALVDLIQTDAAISPGNSGGALVDGEGRVIGVNVAYLPPEARAVSIGFAIPSPTVIDVVEQLLEDGQAEHAFLGVEPGPLTPEIAERLDVPAERGVLVLGVVDDSAATEAGVREGDVITSIDGEPVETVEDLLGRLRQFEPGDMISLEVVRDGETQTLEATLRDRPA